MSSIESKGPEIPAEELKRIKEDAKTSYPWQESMSDWTHQLETTAYERGAKNEYLRFHSSQPTGLLTPNCGCMDGEQCDGACFIQFDSIQIERAYCAGYINGAAANGSCIDAMADGKLKDAYVRFINSGLVPNIISRSLTPDDLARPTGQLRWVNGDKEKPKPVFYDEPEEFLVRIKGDDPISGWVWVGYMTLEDISGLQADYWEWLNDSPLPPSNEANHVHVESIEDLSQIPESELKFRIDMGEGKMSRTLEELYKAVPNPYRDEILRCTGTGTSLLGLLEAVSRFAESRVAIKSTAND